MPIFTEDLEHVPTLELLFWEKLSEELYQIVETRMLGKLKSVSWLLPYYLVWVTSY